SCWCNDPLTVKQHVSYPYPDLSGLAQLPQGELLGQYLQQANAIHNWPCMIAYQRVLGVAGQYKLAARCAYLRWPPNPINLSSIDVFDDDTFERRVVVGPYDNPWQKIVDFGQVKAGDYVWYEWLTAGIVPGNIIIATTHAR